MVLSSSTVTPVVVEPAICAEMVPPATPHITPILRSYRRFPPVGPKSVFPAQTGAYSANSGSNAWPTNRVNIAVTLVDNELDRGYLYRLDAPPRPHSGGRTSPA